jgi:iron complex outermembrane receptor protein
MAELSSNGRHEGTFRYEIGNPNLKSENSHQFEIAYFLHSEHISFEFTPFVNIISNYIFTEKLSSVFGGDSIPDPSAPAPAFIFTQGNTALLGGEIYFDMHPHPLDWLHIAHSFSYVQATQLNQPDSTKNLPFIPAPKYRGELKAEFKKVNKMISNSYFKFGIDYYFRQDKYYTAYETETATPAYTLINAGIGATIIAFKKKDFINLFISGDNLANVAYQSHLNRLKYAPENLVSGRTGVYNLGRNISVKAVINF